MMNLQTLKIFGIIQMLFSAAIFIVLGQKEVLNFTKDNGFRIGVYDDISVNGNSTIKELSEGNFEFSVGDKYQYGFAGVYLQKEDKTLFELGKGKVIDLRISSNTDVNVHLSFEKLLPDGHSTRPFQAKGTLLYTSEISSHQIDLEEFKTPEWWFKDHIKRSKTGLVSDSIVSFNIEFKKSGEKLQSGVVGIDNVSVLTKENLLQLPLGGGLFFVGLILMFIPQKKELRGSKEEKGKNENPIVYYVNSNLYNRSLTIHSVSEHFKLSSDYINERMKTETGLAYKEYVNQKRVDKAKELLKSSEDKAFEIAQLCGFNSSAGFSQTFKAVTGVTPNEYRNSKSDQ